MKSLPIIGALAVLGLAGSAAAKDAKAPALDSLAQCRTIQTEKERLACYDRESAALLAGVDSGAVKVLDRSQVKSIRRSLFGFLAPKGDLLDDHEDDAAETPSILNAMVASSSGLPNGRYRIVLDDGATWVTTENPPRMREPKAGDTIEIERAALGSYWLRIAGRHGVKGRRVE